MPLTITLERFAAIRAKVMHRRSKVLVAEIAATDWDNQPRFQSADDFLKFADTFIERSETHPSRPSKRP